MEKINHDLLVDQLIYQLTSVTNEQVERTFEFIGQPFKYNGEQDEENITNILLSLDKIHHYQMAMFWGLDIDTFTI